MGDNNIEETISKPVLSFGISSILGGNRHQRLLPSSYNRGKRRPQSAFHWISETSDSTPNSHRQDRDDNFESDKKSTANKCHKAEEFEVDTECQTVGVPALKCHPTSQTQDTDSPSAGVSKSETINIEEMITCGEDESDSVSPSKCQQTPSVAASALSFPIVPNFTTQNYFLKSLERFRPKNYTGEYRRVGHPYSNRTPPKRKKPRTTFNREQIAELEARFLGQKYLASTERLRLAKHLHLTDSQVKTWFQNRRTKWRRQTAEEREAERNAATKYILKMQQSAAVVHAANAAAIWPSLMTAHVPPATSLTAPPGLPT